MLLPPSQGALHVDWAGNRRFCASHYNVRPELQQMHRRLRPPTLLSLRLAVWPDECVPMRFAVLKEWQQTPRWPSWPNERMYIEGVL
jgi:hypothetical protein